MAMPALPQSPFGFTSVVVPLQSGGSTISPASTEVDVQCDKLVRVVVVTVDH